MLDGMLLKMYKKSQNKQNGNSSDKELIDISSDDDVNKVEANSNKTNEPEVAEKNLQQKAGPSSCTKKPEPIKEQHTKAVNFKTSLLILFSELNIFYYTLFHFYSL